MDDIFGTTMDGPGFRLLSAPHLAALGVILAVNLGLLSLRRRGERVRTAARWTMALVLWLNELGWHAWNLATGQWTVTTMLPLHVCSVLVWTGGIMLVTRNRRLYEFGYFLGIGGALQALLTPDLGSFDYPHFRYFQTFISHGLIVTAAIYLTTVEGLRPTWRSLWRVIGWTNVYLAVVFLINRALGSNYMFVNGKPPTASILDLMPAWPWYLVVEELVGLVVFVLLYLPFAIGDARARRGGALVAEPGRGTARDD